jgi:hypothetical protein
MTYLETVKDVADIQSPEQVNYLSSFMNSFFPSKQLSRKKLEPKKHRLDLFIETINDYILGENLKRDEKIYWMNRLEKLTLQKEILSVEKGQLNLRAIQKASLHLGKKMQSSFSEPK